MSISGKIGRQEVSMTYPAHIAATYAYRNLSDRFGSRERLVQDFVAWCNQHWHDNEHVDTAFDRWSSGG